MVPFGAIYRLLAGREIGGSHRKNVGDFGFLGRSAISGKFNINRRFEGTSPLQLQGLIGHTL
jgi:hypothetical protein